MSHPMSTRAKTGIFKPKLYVSSIHILLELKNNIEALSTPEWKRVISVEFDALISNDTCELVPPPEHGKIIDKWLFRTKLLVDKSLELLPKNFNKLKVSITQRHLDMFSIQPPFEFFSTWHLQ